MKLWEYSRTLNTYTIYFITYTSHMVVLDIKTCVVILYLNEKRGGGQYFSSISAGKLLPWHL